MIYVEKYDNTHVYMYPSGAVATPEVVRNDFPATQYFTHVVQTDANREMLYAIQNLSAIRGTYNIDASLSEEEAIAKYGEILNTPQEVEEDTSVTPEERIAAALEFQNVLAMNDTNTTEEK
jgi:hypothetical protein